MYCFVSLAYQSGSVTAKRPPELSPKGRGGQLPACLQKHRTRRALCMRRHRKTRSDCSAKLPRCTRGYCEGERDSLKPVTFLKFAAPFFFSTRAGGSRARRLQVCVLRKNSQNNDRLLLCIAFNFGYLSVRPCGYKC